MDLGKGQSVWAAVTNDHTQSGLNSKHLYITALEAEKSKIKMPTYQISAKKPFPGIQMAIFSLYPHKEKSREREQALPQLFF